MGLFWQYWPLCHGPVVGKWVCFGRTVLCVMGSLTFVFCCTVVDVVFAQWGKHTVCEFLSMEYVYESVVGWKGLFWQDCPLCHGLSDFLVLLHCFGHSFCKMGGNTQCVSACPWYMFMNLWLCDGFVLAGMSFVPWAL